MKHSMVWVIKRSLIVVCLAALLGVFGGCISGNYHSPQTTRYYSPTGVYTGKSEKSGSTVRFYSPSGKYIGKGVSK